MGKKQTKKQNTAHGIINGAVTIVSMPLIVMMSWVPSAGRIWIRALGLIDRRYWLATCPGGKRVEVITPGCAAVGAGAGAGGAVAAGVGAEDLVCALVWIFVCGLGFADSGSASASDSDSDSEVECVPWDASESDCGYGTVPFIGGFYIPPTGHSPF